ncbi:MAG: GapR family DNA-binding domain-containing protein, partial [Pseudomonadota bacterium]
MSDETFSATSVAAGQLKAVVERIERLEEEKKEVAEQIKEVYAEAKA